MKTYRHLQWGITLFILLYVVVGYTTWLRQRPEIFPFFSWDLFTYVPTQVKQDFSLSIVAIGGQPLAEPVYFEQAKTLFAKADAIEAMDAIQNLGLAVSANDPAEIARVRAYLEPLFLSDAGAVEYTLVTRWFNPLERWETGVFVREQPLMTFRGTGEGRR